MENVCNAGASIYQPSFPCFIPVIANSSGYAELYNGTSRNKKNVAQKDFFSITKEYFFIFHPLQMSFSSDECL